MMAKILFMLLISVCGLSYAELSRASSDSCEIFDGQIVNHCLQSRMREADKLLNQVYTGLHNEIATQVGADPALISVIKERIRKSQRTWVKLRDENCSVETFIFLPEYPIFEAVKNDCLTREIIDRARYRNNLSFQVYGELCGQTRS